jgi:hypothetical protein
MRRYDGGEVAGWERCPVDAFRLQRARNDPAARCGELGVVMVANGMKRSAYHDSSRDALTPR